MRVIRWGLAILVIAVGILLAIVAAGFIYGLVVISVGAVHGLINAARARLGRASCSK